MEETTIRARDVFIILLLIGNLGLSIGLSYFVLSQRGEIVELNSQISELRKDYISMERGWEGLQGQLENIKYLSSGDEGDQVSIPSRVYTLVKESIVEIRAVVQTLFGNSGATGSGFIYDREGHIVTNAHVVKDSQIIEVAFHDGTILSATLMGLDVYSDLAVVKVDAPSHLLQPVVLGDSSVLIIGDPVLAVGNPFGLSGSLTSGIVSQLDRVLSSEGGYSIVGVIQVDAAINPGNSGGPLLNYLGEVIGVNTAIASQTGEFSGVGFAIPSNLVKKVVPSLIVDGVYKHSWLGITGTEVSPEIAEAMNLPQVKGVLITSVVSGSPADTAGLRGGDETVDLDGLEITLGGDVIVGIDDFPVNRLNDVLVYLEYFTQPEDEVALKVIRKGEKLELRIVLGVRPPLG